MVYGKNITLDQLERIKLRPPKKHGARWQGIKHIDLVNTILTECKTRHWKVRGVELSVARQGADLAGAIMVDIPSLPQIPGQIYAIGFMHSNWKWRPLTIAVGTNVRVCNNGMVTGVHVLREKHEKNLDLAAQIHVGLDRYLEAAKDIKNQVDLMRARNLTEAEADHLLMQCGRQEIMPWNRVKLVDHEYRHPTFAEHSERTSWGLLNAFTYIVKQSPPQEQMDSINAFRRLLPVGRN